MSSERIDVHPEMHKLIAVKADMPSPQALADIRSAWTGYGQALAKPCPADMGVEERDLVPARAGGHRERIPVRLYRPGRAAPGGPCVVYLHGGGFVKGSLDSADTVAWGIAETTGAVTVSVDYRLAPEHPYPAALEDCYAAVSYVAARGAELGVDGERIGLWGDSAGGNLAAATCLAARERGGPRIRAQVLNYPCLTDELSADAYQRFAGGPGFTTSAMDHYWDLYLGDRRPSRDGCAVPLKARDLRGLPPALVHIAEIDPLADDGREYARRLEQAGVETVLRCAERMIHGFLRARFEGPAAAAEYRANCDFLSRHLF